VSNPLPTLGDLLAPTCFAEVARALGVSRSRVWRWRHGSVLLDDAFIEPLAKLLHHDPAFIREVVAADRQRKGLAS
jgi:transcriptional regulator with XRE-family HTH domain